MSNIDYDKRELEEKLIRVCVEIFGYGDFTADTPMHEVRARAEMAGAMFGRAYAACLHEGQVGADIAMAIRTGEQIGKERFLASVGRLCTPGGELREHWNNEQN